MGLAIAFQRCNYSSPVTPTMEVPTIQTQHLVDKPELFPPQSEGCDIRQ